MRRIRARDSGMAVIGDGLGRLARSARQPPK
jgi:hypothetical protein